MTEAFARNQLERILASRTFSRSIRLSALLRFIVEECIKGRADNLKEQVIAVELYRNRLDFEPVNNPAVRVDARRLRDRLREYYESEGASDSMRIDIPKGGYTAQFLPLRPERSRARPRTDDAAPAIAVLPFESFTDDPEQAYLADGLTDGIITELARVAGPRVISRTSVMIYKRSRKPLPEIAWELGVTHVLEGSVIRWSGRIRVSCRFIQVHPEGNLWAESYDRELQDVLKVMEEVARAVANQIRFVFIPSETHRTVSPRAYRAYLKGRYHHDRRTPHDLYQSLAYYRVATALDPTYAPAHAGLAETWLSLGDQGVLPTKESHTKAKAGAQRALELDPSLAEAWTVLAGAASGYDWDWDEGESSFTRALDLSPGSSSAHMLYAQFLVHTGRLQDATRESQIACALDPSSAGAECYYGNHLYMSRRPEDALEHLRASIRLAPDNLMGHFFLGLTHAHVGRLREAIEVFETARAVAPRFPHALALLAYAYAKINEREKALEQLGELRALAALNHVPTFCFAAAALGFDEHDLAVGYLEKTYEERDWLMCILGVVPFFDDLRSHPGFINLVRRMNFPSAIAAP